MQSRTIEDNLPFVENINLATTAWTQTKHRIKKKSYMQFLLKGTINGSRNSSSNVSTWCHPLSIMSCSIVSADSRTYQKHLYILFEFFHTFQCNVCRQGRDVTMHAAISRDGLVLQKCQIGLYNTEHLLSFLVDLHQ